MSGPEYYPLSSFLLLTLRDPSRKPLFTPLLNGDNTRNHLIGFLGELRDTRHGTCLGQRLAQSESSRELIVTPAADQSLISRGEVESLEQPTPGFEKEEMSSGSGGGRKKTRKVGVDMSRQRHVAIGPLSVCPIIRQACG